MKNEIKWDESSLPNYLDEQQREAVKAQESKIIVSAAAGSGKTRVITERVNYLINCGVKPQNIVCITFTNMAAEEMRERLANNPKVGDAFIGTIHSFANKIMKQSGERYELFSRELNIVIHRKLILKYCKFLTLEKWMQYRDLLDNELIGKVPEGSALKSLSFSENAELKLIERPLGEEDKSYPETVETMCRKMKVLTFDEFIKRATIYFKNIKSFPQFVLVDEFQDVGDLEYKFVMGLNAENYFFVGDDWQSIYGWKGANVDIFKMLSKSSDWKLYKLENNYRSGKLIIDLAQKVINQIDDKIDKKVNIISKVNSQFTIDTKYKLGITLDAIKKENKLNDWFILLRKNVDLTFMMEELRKRNITAVSFKREGMSLAEMKALMQLDAIKVLTVHVAKGLESKNVLVYGDSFKLIKPNWMKNEEEIRLMYVAVTRAKENLIILN